MEKSFLIIPEKEIGLEEFLNTLSLLIAENRYRGESENRNKVQSLV